MTSNEIVETAKGKLEDKLNESRVEEAKRLLEEKDALLAKIEGIEKEIKEIDKNLDKVDTFKPARRTYPTFTYSWNQAYSQPANECDEDEE